MRQPLLTTLKAKKLVDKHLDLGGQRFVFDDDIKSGGQAIAVPLKNIDGKRIAFFRSLSATSSTPPMKHRTAWMIGQRLHLLSEVFVGAPQLWVDTEEQQRPEGIDFDFVGTIHGLAHGSSWKSWKEDIDFGLRHEPSLELRLQFAKGLVHRLACLEAVGKSGFTHGDISDANVMLDDATGKVTLIDFDCFIFDSPTLQKSKLMIREGGSKGTPGYIPEWFEEDKSQELAPLGDRFARDMMLLELLCVRAGAPLDSPLLYWSEQEELLDRAKSMIRTLKLDHLQDIRAFEASETERPSSFELADRLGLAVENNVQQALDAEPVFPSQTRDRASQAPASSGSPSSKAKRVVPVFEILTLEELPSFLAQQADLAIVALGKAVLPLLKMGIVGLLGIVGFVLWVLLFVYVMLNLSVPANLVVCGGMGYLTFIAIEKFKSSER